ncbi:hypothetical protein GOHSU_02_02450 [Gordonia hirsuta DSM 44140 = NBRC 16056]|uniref:ABC transporter permease/ATP-binding protein n=1 Tax=Gordonia hirsuta DSM 44140 = NBRC 16056 TaxID=1121927 RepID=L7L5S0_9ACTN|nr:FHA domain-containing protein [Gordonia hirsuta]GAC56096.1 hypothetical protein GOHSU_02_02450 [Gordonia hirsuta DSM 44140 = NBRC 16056]
MNSTSPPPLHVRVDSGPVQIITVSPSTLGRTPDNAVMLNHPQVSRTHLAFVWSPGGWMVVDRGSTNGFFLHGSRVQQTPVNGTTMLRLGDPHTGPMLEVTAHAGASAPPRQQPPVPSQPIGRQSRPQPPVRPHSGPANPGRFHSRPQPPTPQPPTPQPPSAPIHSQPANRPAPPPAFGNLPDAPHLSALHNNASAVYQIPGELRSGRETISVTGAQTIGRTPDNDIVVADVLASRRHARLSSVGGALVIEDLGSVNGTFVNGHRITGRQQLAENDVVTIGNSDFVASGGNLKRGQARALVGGGLQLDGIGLTVDGGKVLLNDICFQAAPGSLTAIIGPSGAGKSTVSKIAAGLNSPTVGVVTFEGRNVNAEYEALRNRIGMVPQDDVLHSKLTVRQALRYAAELRLPADLSTADRDQVIDGVLAELSLTEHAQTRIDKLSGGQRKRASVAMELLTGPSLLILDEPTSGLDPALDRQVMYMLRDLADAGRVVLVVTHSVAHLDICDQVLLLAPGGKTAYCGDPKTKAVELGTDDWAEIFERTAREPDAVWEEYRRRHPHRPPPAAPAMGPPVSPPQAEPMRQLSTVARRQVRLIFADTGYLAFLIALPVVLGLLTLVIPGETGFGPNVYNVADDPASGLKEASAALKLLVVLVIGAAFMGAALTVRDLVSERAIYERERAVGLRPGAYLGAKILVFFVLAVVQSAIMVGLTYLIRATPEQGGVLLPPAASLFVAIAVLACVSTLVGLAISASVKSNEQTMPPLVIVVMVQLVFSGGLFAITSAGAAQLAWIFPSFWGYAAAAQAVDLPETNAMAEQVTSGKYQLWEPSVVHVSLCYAVLIVMGMALGALIYSRLRLRRR